MERRLTGAHHSSSTRWVVHPNILSESKTILGESDLILLRRYRVAFGRRWIGGIGEEVLSSKFWDKGSELESDGKRGSFIPCPSPVPSWPCCGVFDSRLLRKSRFSRRPRSHSDNLTLNIDHSTFPLPPYVSRSSTAAGAVRAWCGRRVRSGWNRRRYRLAARFVAGLR